MILETRELRKSFLRGSQTVHALQGVSLSVARGEFLAIVGPSGSGKSTLLHLMGSLDQPTSGSVLLEGQPLASLSDLALSLLRRRRLGFVFQFFQLVPTMSAEENVALPLLLDGKERASALGRARELLASMGLEDRFDHRPGQLSGGEMQRVAIARALVANPLLLLADEPTGNLDSTTGEATMSILRKVVADRKQTLVLVTHDQHAASFADRVVTMRDGLVVHDTKAEGVG
jgi:putative ABC transport system ATP-binding protein